MRHRLYGHRIFRRKFSIPVIFCLRTKTKLFSVLKIPSAQVRDYFTSFQIFLLEQENQTVIHLIHLPAINKEKFSGLHHNNTLRVFKLFAAASPFIRAFVFAALSLAERIWPFHCISLERAYTWYPSEV